MTYRTLTQALDTIAPEHVRLPEWEEILDRAGVEGAPPRRRVSRRYWIVAVAALIAVLVPLAAIGAGRDWWFFDFGGQSRLQPVTDVLVVKTGEWRGSGWNMIAFRSDSEGLCYGLQPARPGAMGGALGCGPMAGAPDRNRHSSTTITILVGNLGGGDRPVDFAIGPVPDSAVQVDLYLRDGQVVRTPAFDAPSELGAPIRFYATELPLSTTRLNPARGGGPSPIAKAVGLDGDGTIVACLVASADVKHDLSDCQ